MIKSPSKKVSKPFNKRRHTALRIKSPLTLSLSLLLSLSPSLPFPAGIPHLSPPLLSLSLSLSKTLNPKKQSSRPKTPKKKERDMEGGISNNLLDPSAVEFYPSNQFNPIPTQIYIPYPPPPPPPPTTSYNIQHMLPEDSEITRAVIVTLIPPHIDEASLMSSMEAFGPIRSLESSSLSTEGSATVHYYDLRSAVSAVFEIRDQHVRHQSVLSRQYGVVPPNWGVVEWPSVAEARGLVAGQPVWAHFGSRPFDGPNQGALFVSNCDPSLPSPFLAQLFASIGDVKEVKEMVWKPQQRVIEFYDIRDAARAVNELNGKEVYGRRIVVEFTSTPGLSKRSL